jgi:hypothetical protein
MSQPEPAEVANRLALTAVTEWETGRAKLRVAAHIYQHNPGMDVHHPSPDVCNDLAELLWMLGIHDQPEAPGPIHRQSLTKRRPDRKY